MTKSPSSRLASQRSGLPHAFSNPKIVSGRPTSLLKLFSLLRTCIDWAITAKMASLVEVLPTLPVTATIFGWYLRSTARASQRKSVTTTFLNTSRMEVFYPIAALPVRRDIVVVNKKLGQRLKRHGPGLAGKGRARGLVGKKKDDKPRILRREVPKKAMQKPVGEVAAALRVG